MSGCLSRTVLLVLSILLLTLAARADDKPVSFYNDIRPLLQSNCNACHKPDKMKAELDMTTLRQPDEGRQARAHGRRR